VRFMGLKSSDICPFQNTHLMVVRATIRSRTDTSKAPGIDESVERVIVRVLEEERHHEAFKLIGLEHFPRSSMRHPSNNVSKLFLC